MDAYPSQKRHGRTFSEDERIQAQNKVKKIEEETSDEISEPEDPLMLSRDAKDWKVCSTLQLLSLNTHFRPGSRSLRRSWTLQVSLESYAGANQKRPPQEGSTAPS